MISRSISFLLERRHISQQALELPLCYETATFQGKCALQSVNVYFWPQLLPIEKYSEFSMALGSILKISFSLEK